MLTLKHLNKTTLVASAALVAVMATSPAFAGNNFNNIAENITNSISDFPTLLSALSYLFGLLLGVLGVMKVKDHVENPIQTPLKEGAIRLAAGGALFALPIMFESMQNTIGQGSTVSQQNLNALTF
ncbi:MAG: hypothetical protein AB7E85_02410 [Pseudobdellovibrionaceae bacterium]